MTDTNGNGRRDIALRAIQELIAEARQNGDGESSLRLAELVALEARFRLQHHLDETAEQLKQRTPGLG
jgi:hypothetical protein